MNPMFLVILTPFIAAALAPWLQRRLPNRAGACLTLAPLAMTAYFTALIPAVAGGGDRRVALPWVPALNLEIAFRVDGLSLLFALLITAIGALVVLYTGAYLAGHPRLGRFYAALLLFMGAMTGTVLADNILLLFAFWELTGVASFLLIGFESARPKARAAALQALLVTGAGGLALLAGLLLVGEGLGTYRLSEIVLQGDAIRASAWYTPALLLLLAGAFTKSAQFPFQFWLPNAMEAPTPASAYLHSSTMVKAGVYLLARLSPAFGGSEAWYAALTAAGAATMLVSAYLATRQSTLKPMLAYTTLAALGAITAALGIGTEAAVKAAMVFLAAHALYKAALFLIAGVIDHEAGEKDAERLGGLARAMPITAAAAALAALSLAGAAPLFGFIGKEVLLEAALDAPRFAIPLAAAIVLSGAANVLVAFLIAWRCFSGDRPALPKTPREAPIAMLAGPVFLAALGLLFGLAPGLAASSLLAPAAASVAGEPVPVKLALWHGVTPALLLGALALALGALLYFFRKPWRTGAARLAPLEAWGPEAAYHHVHAGLLALAHWQTRVLQHGYLRYYVMAIVVFWIVVPGAAMLEVPGLFSSEKLLGEFRLHETGLAVVIALAALYTMIAKRRLAAVASLGVVGYGVAMIFVLYGAPDVAMTQFVVETLTVLLFVLVFYRLPEFAQYTGRATRLRDLAVAACGGGLMMLLALAAMDAAPDPAVAKFYAENSVPLAHGRNLVNVILVDYRALDTLGEITVLAVSALGVYGLLRLRMEKRKS